MLYTETVTRSTLELLKKLEAERMMVGFNLAGGTSLSLYLGHRLSLDLDLFTPESFDAVQLEQFLKEEYGFTGQMTLTYDMTFHGKKYSEGYDRWCENRLYYPFL